MKTLLLIGLGTVLGAAVGAGIGLFIGQVYVELFQVSCFEGYCGLLVVTCFLPAGGLIGAGLGGAAFLRWGRPLGD